MAKKKKKTSSPGSKTLLFLLILGIMIAIGPWIAMRGIDGDLMAAGSGKGIVAFELAFTPEKAASMMTAWGDALTAEMKRSLLIDFIFIPGYVLLFFAITRLLALWHKGRLEAWGRRVAVLPIIAGVFDVIENLFLILVIKNSLSIPPLFPLVAGMCASIKFALLAITIIFWLFALVSKCARVVLKKK